MIRISPRLILCSLLTLAAASFAYAADEPAKEAEPQKDLPPEVLKVLFPEGVETDPAKISAEAFLRMARRAPAGESWAKMEGTATHRRSGSSAVKDTIRVGIRFTPKRVIAQLVFAGNEYYEMGQTFDTPPVFTQETDVPDKNKTRLSLYGIMPSDLTLGFLYRDLVREEKPESVKMIDCRVFVLKGGENDYVRVWLSTEYFFPLKAHWFRALPDDKAKPYRELELGGVKKENDFYVVQELFLFGQDWRTRVEFDKRDAGRVEEAKAPADLFLSKDDETPAVSAPADKDADKDKDKAKDKEDKK